MPCCLPSMWHGMEHTEVPISAFHTVTTPFAVAVAALQENQHVGMFVIIKALGRFN